VFILGNRCKYAKCSSMFRWRSRRPRPQSARILGPHRKTQRWCVPEKSAVYSPLFNVRPFVDFTGTESNIGRREWKDYWDYLGLCERYSDTDRRDVVPNTFCRDHLNVIDRRKKATRRVTQNWLIIWRLAGTGSVTSKICRRRYPRLSRPSCNVLSLLIIQIKKVATMDPGSTIQTKVW
jgi:hypothetical protein